MQSNSNSIIDLIKRYLIHMALFAFVIFGIYKVIAVFSAYGFIYSYIVSGVHLPLLIFSYFYFVWADKHYGANSITALAIISTGANALLI